VAEVDNVGNRLTLTRSAGRLVEARDAAGRVVQFEYDTAGRLAHIVDLEAGDPARFSPWRPATLVAERRWSFTYDDYNRWTHLLDPRLSAVEVSYYDDGSTATPDAQGLIKSISERHADDETPHDVFFTYEGYSVFSATDPDGGSPYGRLSQNFEMISHCNYQPVTTLHTDRRLAVWRYESGALGLFE
jgi:YD repeat-containing protein